MRQTALFMSTTALAVSLFAAPAQAQGDDVAFDFRTTDVRAVQGTETKGETTGHAVMSKGRMRVEITSNSRLSAIPGATPGAPVTIIMPDTGRTFIILQPDKKRFIQMNPSAMVEGAQKMMSGMGATMTFEMSGDEPRVESLGAGPNILGHHTVHYRMTALTKMSIGAMGQTQTTETSTITDQYIARDIATIANPLRAIESNPMTDMLGESAKDYLNKLKRARAHIPAGASLRTETQIKTTGANRTTDVKSVTEITRIQHVHASPDLFVVPPDYTRADFPMMRRDSGSIRVPKR